MKYERIRNLREDQDLTQAYIGKVLNVTQKSYSRYENRDIDIPIYLWSKHADFYDTSVDYLINRTNIKTPYPKK